MIHYDNNNNESYDNDEKYFIKRLTITTITVTTVVAAIAGVATD